MEDGEERRYETINDESHLLLKSSSSLSILFAVSCEFAVCSPPDLSPDRFLVPLAAFSLTAETESSLGLALTPLKLSPNLPTNLFLETCPTGSLLTAPDLVGMSLGRMIPVRDDACVVERGDVLVVLGAEEEGASVVFAILLLSVINDSAVEGAEFEVEVEVGVAVVVAVSVGDVFRGVEDDGGSDNGGEIVGVKGREGGVVLDVSEEFELLDVGVIILDWGGEEYRSAEGGDGA